MLTCSHCCNTAQNTGIYNKVTNNATIGRVIYDDTANDIAILEFQDKVGDPLKIVTSDSLEIGNEVFTVGFPYSFKCEKTLTVGIVAAFENRMIKINTSVNNGNSGGPLLNMNGKIVGVVNAKLGSLSDFLKTIEQHQPRSSIIISGVDPVQTMQQMIREMSKNMNLGIGYAIPSDRISTACELVRNLINAD